MSRKEAVQITIVAEPKDDVHIWDKEEFVDDVVNFVKKRKVLVSDVEILR